MLIGLVNGLMVTRLKIPSFLVTLGMLLVVRGTALYLTDGFPQRTWRAESIVTEIIVGDVADMDPEAVFGAIYLDGGYAAVRAVVLEKFEPLIEDLPSIEEFDQFLGSLEVEASAVGTEEAPEGSAGDEDRGSGDEGRSEPTPGGDA